jgi:hypothetical protein
MVIDEDCPSHNINCTHIFKPPYYKCQKGKNIKIKRNAGFPQLY